MSRIAQRFADLRSAGRKALIPYVTAGDPHPAVTVSIMHAMVEAGADLIELGVPFSDPMADGPVIQQACERALEHHVGLHDVLDMVREFRERDAGTPVILMGYLNPIEIMGYATFAERAAAVGVDGVLTVDLPPEEAETFIELLRGAEIDPIFLLAPTSDEERIRRICAVASGFIYYVSLKGVTGAASLDVDAVARKLSQIRNEASLPVGVGFGIKDAATAARIARVADAVVVGSAVVRRVAENVTDPARIRDEIRSLLADMRRAMDEPISARSQAASRTIG